MAILDDLDRTIRLCTDLLILGWLSIFLAALFGFFESRATGDYHFRFRRFFLCMTIMVAVAIASSVMIEQKIDHKLEKSSAKAEASVVKNRAIADYSLRFATALFPDELNDDARACYTRGLSNYIEHHWGVTIHNESCAVQNGLYCADTEPALYKKITEARFYRTLSSDFTAEAFTLGTVWKSASSFYTLLRRMNHTPPMNGKFYDPPDDAMLADYQHSLTDCKNDAAMPWADPQAELMQTRLHFCWGACP